jgi:hypothetical protein
VPVDSGAAIGPVAISIGADGLPIIAYRYNDSTPGQEVLKLAKCGDPACSFVLSRAVVDTTPSTGDGNSLTIAPDGIPVISYAQPQTGPLTAGLRVLRCANQFCVPNWTRR